MYSPTEEQKISASTKILLEGTLDVNHLEELRQILRYHEWKYYIQNNPVLSDYEYDMLYKKLESLEIMIIILMLQHYTYMTDNMIALSNY